MRRPRWTAMRWAKPSSRVNRSGPPNDSAVKAVRWSTCCGLPGAEQRLQERVGEHAVVEGLLEAVQRLVPTGVLEQGRHDYTLASVVWSRQPWHRGRAGISSARSSVDERSGRARPRSATPPRRSPTLPPCRRPGHRGAGRRGRGRPPRGWGGRARRMRKRMPAQSAGSHGSSVTRPPRMRRPPKPLTRTRGPGSALPPAHSPRCSPSDPPGWRRSAGGGRRTGGPG